ALAIANDTDAAAQYTITLKSQNSNQTVATGTVNVAARSSVARFADQLIQIPANFVGSIAVSSSGDAKFSIIGLSYLGNVFLTQPATVLPLASGTAPADTRTSDDTVTSPQRDVTTSRVAVVTSYLAVTTSH